MAGAIKLLGVDLPGGSYGIFVKPNLLSDVGTAVRGLTPSEKIAIVTNDTIGPIYFSKVESSLKSAGFDVISAIVPDGESQKTTQTITLIYDQLLARKIERTTPILALGGGVIGDMAGFAAATILRGVPLIQVPTTLLAMVDASVGGKTGVNHAAGKNLIGAFHQPIAVLIDPQVLQTLPRRELCSGLAECIKHDIIRDAEGFSRLERDIRRALDMDIDYLSDLVAHNVAIKAKVVQADPFEKAERAHLNFGHTFGHAIEKVSNYAYAHGECVALGMTAAAHLAVNLGMLPKAEGQHIVNLIAKADLPTSGLQLDVATIVEAMAFDKKVAGGRIRFILPDQIGHVVIRDDVPIDRVRDAVQSLRS